MLRRSRLKSRRHLQGCICGLEYLNDAFEASYPRIRGFLQQGRYRSVLFNLDQSGHRRVKRDTILDIMNSCPAVEIFYTFAIESLLAFLPKAQREKLHAQFGNFGLSGNDLEALDGLMGRQEWLGTAEKLVFDAFRLYAPYVSPFSIHNPDGWRYLLNLVYLTENLATLDGGSCDT